MNARRAYFYSFLSILVILSVLGTTVRPGQSMTSEEEKKLGRKVLEEITKHEDLVRDLSLQGFINRVGKSLLSHIGPTPFDYDFYVIRSRDPNAFAIPGGHIFITRGLLEKLNSEAELASVLGHEVGHVVAQHTAAAISRETVMTALVVAMSGLYALRGLGLLTFPAIPATYIVGNLAGGLIFGVGMALAGY